MLSKKVLSALAAIAVLFMIAQPVEAAAAEEEGEEEIQVVEIVMIPKPTPTPPPDPPVETHCYEHDEKTVELLARFLYISPLYDAEAKRTLLWVVFNRIDDTSGTFGNTFDTVLVKSEFKWFDNDREIEWEDLEKNRRIVRNALDEWVSEDHGFYVGRHVPKCGVYASFVGEYNRGIEVYREIGGTALAW